MSARKFFSGLFAFLMVLVCFPGVNAFGGGGDVMIYQPGAEFSFYEGKWSPEVDIDKLTPAYKKVVVRVGRRGDNLKGDPKLPDGDYFVACRGYLKFDKPYTARKLTPGYGSSTYCVMRVNGKEVYRRNPGQKEATYNEIYLPAGYHPYEVVWFKNKNYFLKIYGSSGDVWHKVPFERDMERGLLISLRALKRHITGEKELSVDQLDKLKEKFKKYRYAFGADRKIVRYAMDVVATFENTKGALWRDHPGMNKRRKEPKGLNWTVYHVMQFLFDEVYTAEGIAKYEELIDGYKFECSDYFPGKCAPAEDPDKVHSVKIKASNKKSLRDNRMYINWPARKPTGTYLAPGTVATVTVPEVIVGKGYQIRVGGHSWDNTYKPRVLRLGRISATYNIDSTETKVANPLGGGIYIEVPYLADAAEIVEVKVKNAVRSPFYSSTPARTTTLDQWQNVERKHRAPWADFQSEKFMFNCPTNWIYNFDDPVTLYEQYDKAMDAVSYLFGFPEVQSKEVMFAQIDLQNRATVFAPGYPSVNSGYNPRKDEKGNSNHHFLRDPRTWPMVELHERCHAFNIMHLLGEREATVHVPHAAMMNLGFGVDMDEAFSKSCSGGGRNNVTIDNQAISWMAGLYFSQKQPCTAKMYKHIGHVHWLDTAKLFGWEALHKFYYHFNMEHEKGNRRFPSEELFAVLCESAAADLRPLWHFWGRFNYWDGENPESEKSKKLAKFIEKNKLPASAKIYDTLVRYKSMVPTNNKEFQEFTKMWWGKQPSIKGWSHQRGHARQWDTTDYSDEKNPAVWPNGDVYNEHSCKRVKGRVQEIIDMYFPEGRPE